MTASALIAASLMWVVLATGVLRTMRIARHVDELTARQWRRLEQLESASGIGFFPTSHARLELEVAIADATSMRRHAGRRRRFRRPSPRWRAAKT